MTTKIKNQLMKIIFVTLNELTEIKGVEQNKVKTQQYSICHKIRIFKHLPK